MPMDLYCMDISPPNRAVYLCLKALNLTPNFKTINLFKGESRSPEFSKINPQHTVPTLDDDGFIIWDSHAINAYLVNKYGKDDSLYPKEPKQRAIVDQRLHFDSGILFPRLMDITYPLLFLKCKEIPEEKRQKVFEAYEFIEKFLEGHDYIAGDNYTIADFSFIAIVSSFHEGLRISVDSYPLTKAWMERCRKTLPGYDEANGPGLAISKSAVDQELG